MTGNDESVKRYMCPFLQVNWETHETVSMVESPTGMYVRYDDIAHLLKPHIEEFKMPPKYTGAEPHSEYMENLIKWLVENEVRKGKAP